MRILTIQPALRRCILDEDGNKRDITVEQLKAYYLSGTVDDWTINVDWFARCKFDWDELDAYYAEAD